MKKICMTQRRTWIVLTGIILASISLAGCGLSPAKKAYRAGLAESFNVNYDAAIAEFTTAISQEPNHAEYYYARGLALNRKGNYDAAIADFNKTIELAPNFVNAYFQRAEAYSQAGRYQEAIADSRKVLEMSPNESGAYSQLIREAQKQGDDKQALELSLLYAEKVPTQRESFEQVWDAATKAHNQEKQLWACDQLERFNSSNFHNAWHCRGLVLYEQGKYKEAIENLTKAMQRGGFEDDCTFVRGKAKAALNQTADAYKDFDRAAKLRDTEYHMGARGVAAYFLGKYDDAISDLSLAIKHDLVGIYRGFHLYRAMAYEKKGLKDLAKKDRAEYAKMKAPNPANSDPLPPNWSLEPKKATNKSST